MNFITPEPIGLFFIFPFIFGGIWFVLHKVIPQVPNWIFGLITCILSLAYIIVIANINEITSASVSVMNAVSQAHSDTYLELDLVEAGEEVCSSSIYYWNLLYVVLLFFITMGVKDDNKENEEKLKTTIN